MKKSEIVDVLYETLEEVKYNAVLKTKLKNVIAQIIDDAIIFKTDERLSKTSSDVINCNDDSIR